MVTYHNIPPFNTKEGGVSEGYKDYFQIDPDDPAWAGNCFFEALHHYDGASPTAHFEALLRMFPSAPIFYEPAKMVVGDIAVPECAAYLGSLGLEYVPMSINVSARTLPKTILKSMGRGLVHGVSKIDNSPMIHFQAFNQGKLRKNLGFDVERVFGLIVKT